MASMVSRSRWSMLTLLTHDVNVRNAAVGVLPMVGILQVAAAPAYILDGVFAGSQHYFSLAVVTGLAAAASQAIPWAYPPGLLTVWSAFGAVVIVRSLLLLLHLQSPFWTRS